MALPTGWPPRPAEGIRSIRFYITGSATANFSDNAYLFSDQASANTFNPLPYQIPGDNTPIAVGDLTAGGTPSGTGQEARDANILAPSGEQAVPHPMIWAQTIRICNDSGANDLEYSFDGADVHGKLLPGEQVIYRNRFEAGIALRGNGTFRIEAW